MQPQSTRARPEPPPPTPVSLEHASRLFDHSLVARARSTRENYRACVRHFLRYLSAGGLDPATATGLDLPAWVLEDYYVSLIDAGLMQRSALTYVHSVQSFLRFLLRHGWIAAERHAAMLGGMRAVVGPRRYALRPVDPALARVVVHALSKPLPPAHEGVGTGVDQQRLVTLRDRAVIAALFSTALRRFELAQMNRGDSKGGCAFVRGKGMRDRTVYFDRDAQAAIVTYLTARTDDDPALFIRHDDGAPIAAPRRLSAHSIGAIIKRAGAEIGVNVTAHQLRHLKARVLLNNGAQLAEVQDILGHNSIETTRRIYAHYTADHIQQAWQRYSRSASELVAQDGGGRPT